MTQTLDRPQTIEVPQQDTVGERVRRGAAYLDKIEPGWYQRVNLATLNIASATHCIIGQLKGNFACFYAVDKTDWYDHAFRHGLCGGGVTGLDAIADASQLTEAWRDLIRERRG